MKASVISIDLAKNVFQVCALDSDNKVILNVKVKRAALLDRLRQFEPTLVVMEACYTANPWGRAIEAEGHTVKLIPPIKVKPFVQGNKNDRNDALAIAEASLRPNMHFVPVKSLEQQDLQSMQRIRERLVRQRTALSNQIRGLLAEYHVVLPKKIKTLQERLPVIIEDAEQPLTHLCREFLDDLYNELITLNTRIELIETRLDVLLRHNPDYIRLKEIPGVGPVVATSVLASVGNAAGARQFKNGRQFSAWLGLTPRHYASGDSCHTGKISKRGNTQLRTALIHGARTVMNWCKKHNTKLHRWVAQLMEYKTPAKVIVALANKLARIIWAVLAKEEAFSFKA